MHLHGLHKQTAKWVTLFEIDPDDAGPTLKGYSNFLNSEDPGCLLDNGDVNHCRFLLVATDFSAFKVEGE